MVVQSLMAEHGLSHRRACIASDIARSTLRYQAVPRDDSGVITFIQAHIALNPRHGFGLVYDTPATKASLGGNPCWAGFMASSN